MLINECARQKVSMKFMFEVFEHLPAFLAIFSSALFLSFEVTSDGIAVDREETNDPLFLLRRTLTFIERILES